jgi:hypothetical protein
LAASLRISPQAVFKWKRMGVPPLRVFEVINLMDALRRSVGRARQRKERAGGVGPAAQRETAEEGGIAKLGIRLTGSFGLTRGASGYCTV